MQNVLIIQLGLIVLVFHVAILGLGIAKFYMVMRYGFPFGRKRK